MPQWMQALTGGWPMIMANLPTFFVILAMITGAVWLAFKWAYGNVIASKNSQIELQDRQLADYQRKLDGATPNQAKAKIDRLEDQISAISSGSNSISNIVASEADIDARAAFFQILESSRWRTDQDAQVTDRHHLAFNWREIRLSTEIHKALRNGRVAAWGEECWQGTTSTPEKPIPPEIWDKVEILFDRTSASRTSAHYKGATRRDIGRMAWVGVKFSRNQIFEIFPLASSPADWKPIYRAVEYVSDKLGDRDTKNCFEQTRLALRQAAYDKRIRVRGKKQMAEPSPHGDHREHSDIYSDVDGAYWTNSVINAFATSPDAQSQYHADPQTAFAWGKSGIYERNRYYDLQVNWNDITREWP